MTLSIRRRPTATAAAMVSKLFSDSSMMAPLLSVIRQRHRGCRGVENAITCM